jgi:hypothetical protein
MSVLDKLIDQWRRCSGDSCRLDAVGKCPRCRRGRAHAAQRREDKQ